MRVMPSNAGETTCARKWSPPPVRSITCAEESGMASSIRRCKSSAVGMIVHRLAMSRNRATLNEAMITIADKGAEKINEFLAQQESQADAAGLRVGVRGGGCSGFQYALAFDVQRDGDTVFES